jgi:hypothetical protein
MSGLQVPTRGQADARKAKPVQPLHSPLAQVMIQLIYEGPELSSCLEVVWRADAVLSLQQKKCNSH